MVCSPVVLYRPSNIDRVVRVMYDIPYLILLSYVSITHVPDDWALCGPKIMVHNIYPRLYHFMIHKDLVS